MSIGTTGKLFFHNSQLLLYTKRFWFSLALNWFSLILNLKMLLQVTIRSIIQGKVTSAWGQGKHHSYIPCYCKMCCESIENVVLSHVKRRPCNHMAKLMLDCKASTAILLPPPSAIFVIILQKSELKWLQIYTQRKMWGSFRRTGQ